MRIRTVKPEFWTSEDIAALDWDARLIFIGLWSYVDDNGVGRDVEKLIAADLFPLEDDPRETLARLARGLRALVAGGQITRYEVDGKRYLYVNAWNHQKIDHPSKGGCYPLPTCENAVTRPDDDPPSRESRETVAPVPGYRGTGVPEDSATRAKPPASPRPKRSQQPSLDGVPEPEPAANSGVLVAEWIRACNRRPPDNVVGQVAKHVGALLEEGFDVEDIREALKRWKAKNVHPSVLPSIVNEVVNPGEGNVRSLPAQPPKAGSGAWNRPVILPAPDDATGVA
jgi:hypothetical protein